MSDIVCVTNRKLCGADFLKRIREIAANHPGGIILREKDLTQEEYKALAVRVKAICDEYGTLCVLHSFHETAAELDIKAVHLPLGILRKMCRVEKSRFSVIGASCHSVSDALEAQRLGCTYITAGHIFETGCKEGLAGRGCDFLRNVCEAVSIPVYAIGGINADNIKQIRDVGAAGACIMSGFMQCGDVKEYLDRLAR